jgi:hypothetical protein
MIIRTFRSLFIAVALATAALASACGSMEMVDDPPAADEALVSPAPETGADDEAASELDQDEVESYGIFGMCGGGLCNVLTHTCCNNHCVRRFPGQLCGGGGGEGSSE